MMKWFEYKEIGIGIGIDIDHINSFSDIVDQFLISELASETGFRSHNSVSVSELVPRTDSLSLSLERFDTKSEWTSLIQIKN